MSNPFIISFGEQPPQMISRFSQSNELMQAFCSDPAAYHLGMITGIRGSGKTVFLTELSENFRSDPSWVVVELNPEKDLLLSFASKLCSISWLYDLFRVSKINLSFLGLGAEIESSPPISDIETAICRMLEKIKEQDKRVLITIDEVTGNDNVRVFAAAFQIFIRQKLPVFLLMTGLYENIYDLQNEKSLTFLYRAPKIRLEPLNIRAMSDRYKGIFGLEDNDALKMASITKGYPFAFQVLGYLTWKSEKKDMGHIIAEFDQYLAEYVYDKIWSTLSANDRLVLAAMAHADNGKVAIARDILSMDAGKFGVYRDRLMKKSLIQSKGHGYIDIILPRFAQYIDSHKYD